MEKDKVRIGSIVIDCNDFARIMAIWQAALRYVATERLPPRSDNFIADLPYLT